jgi:AcrR family transcriptional regulator
MSVLDLVPKPRRTQEERSATTRALLLDATIDCLFELGYASTTTTEIVKRAGLSRGAQLHHFPTKAELVTTAVDHLFARRTEEFRNAFAEFPDGVDRAAAAIDLLWSMVSGETFYAWLELMVAARTDADLQPVVSAMAERFAETVQSTFREVFPEPAVRGPFFDVAPAFAFAVLQGLALDRISVRNDAGLKASLDLLKTLAGWAVQEPK